LCGAHVHLQVRRPTFHGEAAFAIKIAAKNEHASTFPNVCHPTFASGHVASRQKSKQGEHRFVGARHVSR
jgi:hypothetical protein